MQFQGARSFPLPPEILFARLADATFLVDCIPDATPVGSATPDAAQCAVRPNFSFARGRLDISIRVLDRQPAATLTFLVVSKGIGSGADVEAALTLIPAAGATNVAWIATIVKLGGLLKAVPAGLIRGAAQKVIDDVWTGIDVKLMELRDTP